MLKTNLRWLTILVALGLMLSVVVGCTTGLAIGSQEGAETPTAASTPQSQETPTPTPKAQAPIRMQVPGNSWIGVSLEAVDDGVRVAEVVPDSPAEKAGVKVGDVIKWVDGNRVRQPAEVANAVAQVPVGEQMTLTVARNNEEENIEITVGSRSISTGLTMPSTSNLPEGWLWHLPMFDGIKGDEAFKHFVKGEYTVLDKNGNEVTLTIVGGSVKAIATDSVTITPNGQGVNAGPYQLDETTVIWNGARGAVKDIAVGDSVLVATVKDSTQAVAVVKWDASRPWLNLPDASSIPGLDSLRERLRDFDLPGLPDLTVPDSDSGSDSRVH